MRDLQAQLAERFPRLFAGRRARLVGPLVRGFGRWSRLPEAADFLETHGHLRGLAFVDVALRYLEVRYTVDQVERERIPETGRLLIVANHPCGALDALALLHLVGSVRPDVRVLANDLLAAVTPLRELMLPLRILGGRPTPESLRAVEEALAKEQCVIVFPAGEVSRLGWRGSRIHLRVGQAQRIEAGEPDATALVRVRRALAAIGSRREPGTGGPEPIAHAVDRRLLVRELARLPLLGSTPDGKRIHAGRLAPDSPLLQEIGRLRELSFRAAGEGTGKRLDIDAYDAWYDHLVLWDPEALEIAGGYRVAPGERVFAERGVAGFYTASLFKYPCSLLPRLAQGMELGRSFVAPAYQGSRSLDYLWHGIGAYLRHQPGVRYLFGPVSISAALPLAAREQMVAYYSRYFGDAGDGVAANRPFRFAAAPPDFGPLGADEAFRLLKANLGALGTRVPTLYKQYTELCEPGGARFLAFGVDPDFNHSVDGLIELDLARIQARKRGRYLGDERRTLAGPEAA